MFNLFFRRYVPGFRVGPDGVPGFNIDDYGLPQRTTASFDDTLAGSAAQRYPDAGQAQNPPNISFRFPGAAAGADWTIGPRSKATTTQGALRIGF